MKIMLTGCAGPAGRALLQLLAPTEHELIGVDMAPQRDARFAASETVPAASAPDMLPALRQLLEKHRVDLLIPTVSDELPQVALAAAADGWPAPTAIGSPDAVAICDDKYLTMHALASAGVPIPRFALPSEFPDAATALHRMGGPLVVKPRVGRGGRGVRVIQDATDLDWSTLDDSLIVQEFAPGTEYAPMVHRSAAAEDLFVESPLSEDPLVVVLEKTELKSGTVGNAVSVRRLPATEARDVAAVASHAIIALGLHGPVDLDVRRTIEGLPVVLEVNARFGANSHHVPEILDAVLADQLAHQLAEQIPTRSAAL